MTLLEITCVKMFLERNWIKAVRFGKSAIRMFSPQLNSKADSIDFEIMNKIIIERLAERMDIFSVKAAQQPPPQEVHQQPPPQEAHQQPPQQPEASRGLAALNLWGSLPSIPRVIISHTHTGNQKYLYEDSGTFKR
jgi:hypothetical protein